MSFDVTGDAYDRFMGRYSRPLAARVADFMEVAPGQRVLDVGCGPGALTGALVDRVGADHVWAVDPSTSFVESCRSRHRGVDVRCAAAESLPFDDETYDATGANLVIHFLSDPIAGVGEMARVTRDGGRVAATVWDLAGLRHPMWPVWVAVAETIPGHPGEPPLPGASRTQLVDVFAGAQVRDVESVELEVTVVHPSFEDWWAPFLRGVGPVGELLAELDPAQRDGVRSWCVERLGGGPFELTAVAFAARGHARH